MATATFYYDASNNTWSPSTPPAPCDTSTYKYMKYVGFSGSWSTQAYAGFSMKFQAERNLGVKQYDFGSLAQFNVGSVFAFPDSSEGFENNSNCYWIMSPYLVTNTFEFQFTDSLSSASGNLPITQNGTFDISQYASVTVNVPQENITTELAPYSDLVVDSFWQYHKAFASAVAAIIVIFLVYRLLKSRLK